MVPVPSWIAIRENEWLLGVHRLVTDRIKLLGSPVDLWKLQHIQMLAQFEKFTNLHENSRQGLRVLWITASTTVGASGQKGDMGLVVGRINVLSVPATWEVELRTDATGALGGWKLVISG